MIDCSSWISLLKRCQISGVVLSVLRRWYSENSPFTIQRQRANGYSMNHPVLSGKIPPLSSTDSSVSFWSLKQPIIVSCGLIWVDSHPPAARTPKPVSSVKIDSCLNRLELANRHNTTCHLSFSAPTDHSVLTHPLLFLSLHRSRPLFRSVDCQAGEQPKPKLFGDF